MQILGLLGMYFDAVVVEFKTFLLLFRLTLAILCNVWLMIKINQKLTLTCTISKEPGCLSLCMMVPTRPVLRPPVTMHKFPASNLMESMILPVLMSNLKNVGKN